MAIDAGSAERSSIIRTLQKFTLMCTMGGDETLPHAQNQKILYNYGNSFIQVLPVLSSSHLYRCIIRRH